MSDLYFVCFLAMFVVVPAITQLAKDFRKSFSEIRDRKVRGAK